MTNAELLLEVLGEIENEHIEEVDKRISNVKKRRSVSLLSIAAALVLVVTSVIPSMILKPSNSVNQNLQSTVDKDYDDTEEETEHDYYLGYNSSPAPDTFGTSGGCANEGMTGYARGGYFYYEIPDDGIYRYTASKGYSEKIVDIKLTDSWYKYTVNDIGLFYSPNDKTVYKVTHNSNEATVFYTYENADWITPYPYTANDIRASIHYDTYSTKDIIIDGVTGEEKTVLSDFGFHFDEDLYNELLDKHMEDPNSYTIEEIYDLAYKTTEYWVDEITHQLGDRTLVLKLNENGGGFTLTENGERIEEYYYVSGETPVKATDDYMVFSLGQGGTVTDPVYHYYIARADGNDTRVISTYAYSSEGDSEFFYYIDFDGNITCLDVKTNEKSVLTSDSSYDCYDLYSDGEYLYLFRYTGETSAKELSTTPVCYKINKDSSNKPYELVIADDNILE